MAGDRHKSIPPRLFVPRIASTGRVAAAAAWAVALAGLALYLLKLGSGDDSYGGLGTAAFSLLWLTLLGVLYYVTPKLWSRPAPEPIRRPSPRVLEPQVEETATLDEDPTATELACTVAIALRNDSAHGSMSSVVCGDPAEVPELLSEVECDLIDWGFTYGVAWAVARSRYPEESDQEVANRALAIAEGVFRDYCGAELPA
jgi:hypothetical protein